MCKVVQRKWMQSDTMLPPATRLTVSDKRSKAQAMYAEQSPQQIRTAVSERFIRIACMHGT